MASFFVLEKNERKTKTHRAENKHTVTFGALTSLVWYSNTEMSNEIFKTKCR